MITRFISLLIYKKFKPSDSKDMGIAFVAKAQFVCSPVFRLFLQFSIFQDDPRASFSLFSPAGSIDLLSGIGFNHTIFKCSLQIYFNIFFSIQSSTISNFQIILDFTFHVYCEKKFFPGFLLFLVRLISKY